MRKFVATSIVAALFVSANLAHASLITNGSFESAATGFALPGSSGSSLAAGSTAIDSWTVIGGPGSDGLAWLSSTNTNGITPEDGFEFLDLTGFSDRHPYFGVSQSIATTSGQTYTLSFYLGVENSNRDFAGPVSVNVTAGPLTMTNVGDNNTPTFGTGTGNIWTLESLNFTANASTSTISISGDVGDEYLGLDNVSVVALPEPGTFLMIALALSQGSDPAVSRKLFDLQLQSLDFAVERR